VATDAVASATLVGNSEACITAYTHNWILSIVYLQYPHENGPFKAQGLQLSNSYNQVREDLSGLIIHLVLHYIAVLVIGLAEPRN